MPQPLGLFLRDRPSKGNARFGNRLLGPADPLGHRRLGHEERVGDFSRRQTSDGAQRERNGRGRGQRRMATHEKQDQRIVFVGGRSVVGRFRSPNRIKCHLALASTPGRFAAKEICHRSQGDLGQPGAGIFGHSIEGPLPRRGERRLLDRILGRGESLDTCA